MVTLSNGVTVINFSSPHEFKFVDGSVLPAIDKETSLSLKVDFIEDIDEDGDVSLSFELSPKVMESVEHYQAIWEIGLMDKVIIPLPMMTALKNQGRDIKKSPFRCIRIENRIDKLVSIDKWCI